MIRFEKDGDIIETDGQHPKAVLVLESLGYTRID